MFEKVEQLDISEYSSAYWAANATKDKIQEIADNLGQSPEIEVHMKENHNGYTVYWEGGPHNWAINLVGGEAIFGNEPEIKGFQSTEGFGVDCEYSFALLFYRE